MKKPELLMPASSLEVLRTAIDYGADAVYIGGDLYGLRAKAKNFTRQEMTEGINYAHSKGKKVYVTANITAHNDDLSGIREYFSELKNMEPDALIISDPGVFDIARDIVPEMEVHISTQANNVNYGTYRFWNRMGAKRVVSARELSLNEIADIRNNIPQDMEIETFVHGAMCISYSGRCLLSNYLTGRDANLGACTHPCRWKYFLMEESRPGEYMPIEENERGTFIFNSKDLCMIDHIPELVEAGIDSFKVEGRMKTALYVATVARAYRLAIDAYFRDSEEYKRNLQFYYDEITKCTNRHFTTGFFFGKPGEEAQIYENSSYVKDYIYLGTLEESVDIPDNKKEKDTNAMKKATEGMVFWLEQKNKFNVGEELEAILPDGSNIVTRVKSIYDEEGNTQISCPHAKQRIIVQFDKKLGSGIVLRKEAVSAIHFYDR